MKVFFDKKAKDREFLLGDLVLKWEARREDIGKHGKFDHLWFGPYNIATIEEINSFFIQSISGDILEAHVNGRCLKHFIQ